MNLKLSHCKKEVGGNIFFFIDSVVVVSHRGDNKVCVN